jgi:hypothetical protein
MKHKLTNLSYWKVAQVSDVNDKCKGRNRMIQAMKEIFPIIKAFINEDIVNKYWKENMLLENAFPAFIEILKDALTNINKGVSAYLDFDEYNYSIKLIYEFVKSDTVYFMPLDFLPDLFKTNRELYCIVIEALSLLKAKDIYVFEYSYFDDYFVYEIAEDIMESGDFSEDEKRNLEKDLIKYKKHGNRYHKLLSIKKPNKEKFCQLIDKYINSNDPGENIILTFCQKLLGIYDSVGGTLTQISSDIVNSHIENNDLDPENPFEDGYPIHLENILRFIWFSNDHIQNDELAYISDIGNNFGQLTEIDSYKCKNKKSIDEFMNKCNSIYGNLIPNICDAIIYGSVNYKYIQEYSLGIQKLKI